MLITLTTDFGLDEPFAGIMKGVIARINPDARVIDLSHGIPPHNVVAGALVLRHAVEYFPSGTIHVAVVDPGVGGARRPLLIEAAGSYFVGPDNGVLSLALENERPSRITHPSNPTYHLQPASATFHGRDIFAPVAAHLSLGIAAPAFGPRAESFVRLELPPVKRRASRIIGEIIYIDGFGNLFTNIRDRDLTELGRNKVMISLGELSIRGLGSYYAAGAEGEMVALINSWGLLEIAVYKGNAQRHSAAKLGDMVEITAGARQTGGR